jgi:hypothetical protein
MYVGLFRVRVLQKEMPDVLETVAKDKKHKREVCRYWMNGMCKKEDCEFLHVYDASRMSECPFNESCRVDNCPLKHTQKKLLCLNYEQGFCSLGRYCPHRHVVKEGPPPFVASFFLEGYTDRPADGPHFRKKVCSYWSTTGWCPYFDMCAFLHAEGQ